jgi:hypothetical protein
VICAYLSRLPALEYDLWRFGVGVRGLENRAGAIDVMNGCDVHIITRQKRMGVGSIFATSQLAELEEIPRWHFDTFYW